MDNEFYISLRLLSDNYDFADFIHKTYSYSFKHQIKGRSIFKTNPKSSHKAIKNVFLFSRFYEVRNFQSEQENIESVLKCLILEIESTFKVLPICIKNMIHKEVIINGFINTEQFGFDLSIGLINLLSQYDYSLGVSCIAFGE